jgi:hypothetical protein
MGAGFATPPPVPILVRPSQRQHAKQDAGCGRHSPLGRLTDVRATVDAPSPPTQPLAQGRARSALLILPTRRSYMLRVATGGHKLYGHIKPRKTAPGSWSSAANGAGWVLAALANRVSVLEAILDWNKLPGMLS